MLNFLALLFLIFSTFLNADVSYAQFPHESKQSAKMNIRESKTCKEYLSICENSCKDRGTIFKFQCIGQDFQPFQEHSFCQCGDDIFRQTPKVEQISIKQESAP